MLSVIVTNIYYRLGGLMGYSKKLLFAVYGQFILVFSLISAVEFHKGFGLNA